MAVVTFNLGLVTGVARSDYAFVRAVRGPAPAAGQRFVGNGDGTITDRVTRLVWEKKCDCPGGLHDFDSRLPWSFDGEQATIWDWLDEVNSEDGEGFARHHDWRIPNIKELATLLDHGRSAPNIFAAFTQAKCNDLGDPRCSWTEPGLHWSSTTFADFPAHALATSFSLGYVDDRLKTMRLAVRAVRGPVQDAPVE